MSDTYVYLMYRMKCIWKAWQVTEVRRAIEIISKCLWINSDTALAPHPIPRNSRLISIVWHTFNRYRRLYVG